MGRGRHKHQSTPLLRKRVAPMMANPVSPQRVPRSTEGWGCSCGARSLLYRRFAAQTLRKRWRKPAGTPNKRRLNPVARVPLSCRHASRTPLDTATSLNSERSLAGGFPRLPEALPFSIRTVVFPNGRAAINLIQNRFIPPAFSVHDHLSPCSKSLFSALGAVCEIVG